MLSEILARLLAELPATRFPGGVEIAEDIDALAARAGQVDNGTAIIMPWRERAGPELLATGGHRQRVAVQFLVGTVVREYDQLMGGDRALAFDTRKIDCERALAGWTPPSCTDACVLVGGESSPIDTGISIYVQTWETARFLTGD